jgi:hypothetical protein
MSNGRWEQPFWGQVLRSLSGCKGVVAIWFVIFVSGINLLRAESGLASEGKVLQVKRFWSIKEAYPKQEDGNLRVYHAKWSEGKLWFCLRDIGGFRLPNEPIASQWILQKIEPETMTVLETVRGNMEEGGKMGGAFFDVQGNTLYAAVGPYKLITRDITSGVEKSIPVLLPNDGSVDVMAKEKAVFIGSSDRLVSVDKESGKLEILVSKRRQPPANELDAFDWFSHPIMLKTGEDQIGFVFGKNGEAAVGHYDQSIKKWTVTFHKPVGNLSFAGDRHGFKLDEYSEIWTADSMGKVIPLLSRRESSKARWHYSAILPSNISGQPVFYHPVNVHGYDGERLWILFGPIGWQSKSSPLGKFKDRDLTLWCYDPRWSEPVEIPLKLELKVNYPDWPKVYQQMQSNSYRPQVMATSEGLLLLMKSISATGGGYQAAGFIPMKELVDWLDKHQPVAVGTTETARPDDKAAAARRFISSFDRNGNGKIEEYEAPRFGYEYMQTDGRKEIIRTITSREFIELLDVNSDGSVDQNEVLRLISPEDR